MLILYYQRLYLIFAFLSGQATPLLAIHTSGVLSKPNTSPYKVHIILYYILGFVTRQRIEKTKEKY